MHASQLHTLAFSIFILFYSVINVHFKSIIRLNILTKDNLVEGYQTKVSHLTLLSSWLTDTR